jgi:hypothetical protein
MYLKNNCLSLESLNKIEKRKLLSALQNEGAFASKNAASYVADVLQISRATVLFKRSTPSSVSHSNQTLLSGSSKAFKKLHCVLNKI